MNRIEIVGLSHHTAPLEVREALAVPGSAAASVIERVVADAPPEVQAEAVVLSTCNRVELYTFGCDHGFASLCDAMNVDQTALHSATYRFRGEAAVRHLFRVSASLDSMVPGETQILGQVRRAYETSRKLGRVGPGLHGLFQRAMAVGKQVMAETDLAAGRYSVASVAAAYADEVLGRLDDKRLLCVGVGKMSRLVLEHLHARAPSHRPGSLLALSRDPAKAQTFAGRFGGQGAALPNLAKELSQADLVVCATGSRDPVITKPMVEAAMAQRPDRPMFIIDIAVPRDVDPAAGSVKGVHLYDLDDLQRATERTVAERRSQLHVAEAIVEQHVARHIAWYRGRDLGGTIDKLYRRSHATAEAEVARTVNRLLDTLPDLPPEQRDAVERQTRELGRRLVNKLLHGPVSTLRQQAGPDRHPAYRHAVEKLFSLEEGE